MRSLAVLSILVLTSLCCAEELHAGPYLLKYNLGQEIEPVVVGPMPARLEGSSDYAMYQIWLNSSSDAAMIVLSKYPQKMTVSQPSIQALAEGHLRGFLGCSRVTSEDRTIDGRQGVMSQGVDRRGKTWIAAGYWPDEIETSSGRSGSLQVAIASSYPQETTERFLDSLHLEIPG